MLKSYEVVIECDRTKKITIKKPLARGAFLFRENQSISKINR